MLKIQDNPPVLFPADRKLADIEGQWWIGHTKARCEKAFAWELLEKEVPFFLPMVPRTTFSGGRKRRGMAALFPSYVFFAGDEVARHAALRTNRLCQTIAVKDQGWLRRELSGIELVLKGDGALDAYPFAAVGQVCRIGKGPFQGLVGKVVNRDKTARFVLEVSVLGQGVALEIDADLLEAI